jgi:hypothetical protein
VRLFPQARADDLQHLHSFSQLVAASEGAIFAVQWGHTANAQWRRVAQQQAGTTQPRAPERSLAARNVRRAGKDEANWLRREYSPAPREANRASPLWAPPPGISGDRPMVALASHTALPPEKGGYRRLIPGSAMDPRAS